VFYTRDVKRGSVVCPVLSVTLVYCDQTPGWIKMPLGTEVGLGPGHIVFDGNPAPQKKGAQPHPKFWPMSVVANRLDQSINQLQMYIAPYVESESEALCGDD